MTLNEFIAKWSGKAAPNNSGGFLNECVSLASQFSQNVLNVPNSDGVLYCQTTGGARDLYESPTALELQHYDKIPPGSPQINDLVVWGSSMGQYGDVAIYIGNNEVFGQQGTPVFLPANIRTKNSGELGYLRLKGEIMWNITKAQENAIYQLKMKDFPGPDYNGYAGLPATQANVDAMIAKIQGLPEPSTPGFTPYKGPPLFVEGPK